MCAWNQSSIKWYINDLFLSINNNNKTTTKNYNKKHKCGINEIKEEKKQMEE